MVFRFKLLSYFGLSFFILANQAESFAGAPGVAFDRREKNPPHWYQELKGMSGVNIPHLPGDLSSAFIQHPNFHKNWVEMGWNAVRLPISASEFFERGQYDFRYMHGRINELIRRLHQVHNAQVPKRRFLLILDFHQFKFGPVCGGDGIPRGWINEKGLNKDDNNCLFYAWDRFWKNDQNVQGQWIEFAKRVLEPVGEWSRLNSDWLTIGIEPMNEPFAGVDQPLFTDGLVGNFLRLGRYMKDDQRRQVKRDLLPFYEKFLKGISSVSGFEDFRALGLMVFDPFVLDQLEFKVWDLPPIRLAADSDYSAAFSLKSVLGSRRPVRWISAPHHYAGSYDAAFRDFFPDEVRKIIDHYPNRIFDRKVTFERFDRIQKRMAEAGMDFILGEYGTYTRLQGPKPSRLTGKTRTNFRGGGYGEWIKDVQDANQAKGGMGAIWWRYHPDFSDDLTSYDLLVRDWGEQQLKCDQLNSVVVAVFNRCVKY